MNPAHFPSDHPLARLTKTGPLRVPGIDEDEATMAVAAAGALLERQGIEVASLEAAYVSSVTASGWGATFAEALGLPADHVHEGAPPAESKGRQLVVESHAARAGSPELDTRARTSLAAARLAGSSTNPTMVLGQEAGSVPLSPDVYARLAKWEREAPLQVPRGAYVPEGTWARSRAARYRLLAGECPKGHKSFPPRPACVTCGAATRGVALPRRGVLETYAGVAKGGGPSEFDALQETEGEYVVGVAAFGGVRVPGMVCETHRSALRVGLEVEPVFRRLFAQEGVWRYGLKLRGAFEAQKT